MIGIRQRGLVHITADGSDIYVPLKERTVSTIQDENILYSGFEVALNRNSLLSGQLFSKQVSVTDYKLIPRIRKLDQPQKMINIWYWLVHFNGWSNCKGYYILRSYGITFILHSYLHFCEAVSQIYIYIIFSFCLIESKN